MSCFSFGASLSINSLNVSIFKLKLQRQERGGYCNMRSGVDGSHISEHHRHKVEITFDVILTVHRR